MAVATEREYGLFIDGAVVAARAVLAGPWGKTPSTERSRLLHALDLYLETKSIVTYTGSRPTNPFGL